MGYKLTKADYEDIHIITVITESILENYNKLIELEAGGEKNSLEYQRVVEQLKSSLQMEPVVYGRIGNSFPKINAIIEHFIDDNKKSESESDFELLISRDEQSLMIRRIANKLASSIAVKDDIKKELQHALNDGKIEILGDESDVSQLLERLAKNVSNNLDMMYAFKNDDTFCFLTILQNIINSPFQKNIHPVVVSSKYYTSFINEIIEHEMIKNNFEVPSKVYLSANLLGEISRQDSFFTTILRKKLAIDLVWEQTNLLLEKYDDVSLTNSDVKGEASVRTCLIRTGLLSLDYDEIEKLNKQFHEIIETDEYIKSHPTNTDVEDMISHAYSQVKKDRSIPIQVSVKQKKI